MTQHYQRKLYAFLHNEKHETWGTHHLTELTCLDPDRTALTEWWNTNHEEIHEIASSSDRLNIRHKPITTPIATHPISGQKHNITSPIDPPKPIPESIKTCQDPEQVYWWFWRFYPEWRGLETLLEPAHTILPDNPLHSYQTTVAAIAGARFDPENNPQHPYLLLFSFSPIQDFIKASRKFLDFWAGSYLLHYLSARLCWHVAQTLGPDALITPSLWSQEIIDAFLLEKYPNFDEYFKQISPDKLTPIDRWKAGQSTSLSTAGFPNAIVILFPGKAQAQHWGEQLTETLKSEWQTIAHTTRNHIRQHVSEYAREQLKSFPKFLDTIANIFPDSAINQNEYYDDLVKWETHSNWEWNPLWDAQINHTWEPYWTAIPLGKVNQPLTLTPQNQTWNEDWIDLQNAIAQPPLQPQQSFPTHLEKQTYQSLNVGTWWGNIQQRLRTTLNAVKAQRNWEIPIAPGSRSTISGQYTAVHPRLNHTKFAEGGGLSDGKMRFFWWFIAQAYPGLFDGSEQLNALELTKRMAWNYGGVSKSLGIIPESDIQLTDYDNLIRFPNASSIAAARFACDSPEKLRDYWNHLRQLFENDLAPDLLAIQSDRFARTTRPFQIRNADLAIKSLGRNSGFNGMMFSSKWLAEDMNLSPIDRATLRQIVDKTHRDQGFKDSSPSDWWVMLLADGDGMGGYVSGQKLEKYADYIPPEIKDDPAFKQQFGDFIDQTQKRMGPATHIGLNRALLDFSNRLVPYLTEQRFCGKVVYSGGDDVMALLPLEDLPGYLRSLRAAWQGQPDPEGEFACDTSSDAPTGYWHPRKTLDGIPNRPLFTMGETATLSAGIIIAHKSVPLPTVLESLWTAEKDQAKQMPGKDGLCFRVIYGNGNQLTALMPGRLLESWWNCIKDFEQYKDQLAPILYRLSEDLPKHASLHPDLPLVTEAAKVIMGRRENAKELENEVKNLESWFNEWEQWALNPLDLVPRPDEYTELNGNQIEDLSNLLRFTAFWVAKRVERYQWSTPEQEEQS